MTLTEFLLARIAEDEVFAREVANLLRKDMEAGYFPTIGISVDRVLAECEAKRRIIEQVSDVEWGGYAVRDTVLSLLTVPYADHPDYEEGWRP